MCFFTPMSYASTENPSTGLKREAARQHFSAAQALAIATQTQQHQTQTSFRPNSDPLRSTTPSPSLNSLNRNRMMLLYPQPPYIPPR